MSTKMHNAAARCYRIAVTNQSSWKGNAMVSPPACTECGLPTKRLVDGKCSKVASCNRRRARNGDNPYRDIDLHDQTRIITDHRTHLQSDSTTTQVRQALEHKRCKQSEADAADYAFRDTVRDARRRGYTAEEIASWTGLTPSRIYQIWSYRRV